MRLTGILVPLVVLVPAATASAALGPYPFLTKSPYMLKRPAHEHCKRDYARVTKHVRRGSKRIRQVWCEYRIPTRTELSVTPAPGPQGPRPGEVIVGADVSFKFGGSTEGAYGPVTVEIIDTATHKRIVSFKQANGVDCGIAMRPNPAGTEETLSGIEVLGTMLASWPPCPMATVTKPVADGAEVVASFAQASSYAASASPPVPL